MRVFKPPFSLNGSNDSINSIFLAGSIEMGKAEDWQNQFIYAFQECSDACNLENEWDIFNPRRDEWDPTWTQSIENAEFYRQVNWELEALERANHIIMYFAPNTISPISLLEFGLYARSGKLLVVCPKEFYRNGNIEIVAERYRIPMFDSLDEVISRILL